MVRSATLKSLSQPEVQPSTSHTRVRAYIYRAHVPWRCCVAATPDAHRQQTTPSVNEVPTDSNDAALQHKIQYRSDTAQVAYEVRFCDAHIQRCGLTHKQSAFER